MLLSHSQLYSTIAAGALNYRVREGNVCDCSAMDTGKKYKEESLESKSATEIVRPRLASSHIERDLFPVVSGMEAKGKKVVKPHG